MPPTGRNQSNGDQILSQDQMLQHPLLNFMDEIKVARVGTGYNVGWQPGHGRTSWRNRPTWIPPGSHLPKNAMIILSRHKSSRLRSVKSENSSMMTRIPVRPQVSISTPSTPSFEFKNDGSPAYSLSIHPLQYLTNSASE